MDLERSRPLLAQYERHPAQFVEGHLLAATVGARSIRHQHQFVGDEFHVVQPLVMAGAFDQPEVDIVACEGLFDLLAVARDQGNPHVGEADGEPRQHAREEVLGDGAAGSEPQAAALTVGLEAHFVLQLAVFVGDALGIGEQGASRVGEDEAAAVPLEELGLVAGFQLADVLAHGRLRDVELLGASREAERLGRSDENPEPEIVHISPGSRRGRTPRPNARSGRWFAASYRTTCRRPHCGGRRR